MISHVRGVYVYILTCIYIHLRLWVGVWVWVNYFDEKGNYIFDFLYRKKNASEEKEWGVQRCGIYI